MFCLPLFFDCNTIEEKTKPTILFILVDDLEFADLGNRANKSYELPNVDALAMDGMIVFKL